MKKIVIAGASSGLGNAIARVYASRGWRVGATARRSGPLDNLAAEFPGLIETAEIDITRTDAPFRLKDLITRLGGMDIYLHAAGTGKQNPTLNTDIERTTLMTNCVGFAAMTDTAFNYFRDHPEVHGQLVAITSVDGTKGLGMAASYSASKRFGSTYLTALEQLAHLEGIKLSITDIRPGFIATELLNPDNRYPMLMTTEHAVPLIIKAIDRRRRIAIIDSRWHWLVTVWKMIPRCMWVRFKATTSKKQS